MAFLTFIPTSGDTDNVLLQKIVQVLAAGGGSLTMGFLKVLPTSGDTDNVLLQKIVQILAGPTGMGGGVFIAAIGGSGTNITLAGTTVFSGCVGSNISFCPDNTWSVGIAGALPKSVDVATSYKYNGVDVIIATVATDNYFFGNSGNLTVTAIRNTAVGSFALAAVTSGSINTAVGYKALFANTSGNTNTAIGFLALTANTTGINNTAIGGLSLTANTTGSSNVAVGAETLRFNTTGDASTAVGFQALSANTVGVGNTALGNNSLTSNTSGLSNTAVGNNSLASSTSGSNNTAIGAQSMVLNGAGSSNVAVGRDALLTNADGSFNAAFGNLTLRDLNPALGTGENTAVGYNTGRGIVTGIQNTILGSNVTGLAAALSNNIIIADGAGNQRITANATGDVTVAQSLTVGKNLVVPTGANQRAGNAVLAAGTRTIANTTVTASTLLFHSRKIAGGTLGNLTYTITPGVAFTINSDNGGDTSTVSYLLVENP